jgi:hypothetical protein
MVPRLHLLRINLLGTPPPHPPQLPSHKRPQRTASLVQKFLCGGAIVFGPVAVGIAMTIAPTEPGAAMLWFSAAAAYAVIAMFIWDEFIALDRKWRIVLTSALVLMIFLLVYLGDAWAIGAASKTAWDSMKQDATSSKLYGLEHPVKSKDAPLTKAIEDESSRAKPIPNIGRANSRPQPKPVPPSRGDVADVKVAFVSPTELSVMPTTISESTAWDIKIEVDLWNLDEARNASLQTGLSLPEFVQVTTGDFLKSGQSYTPRTVLDAAKSSGRLKDGDRLAGFGAVTCSNCGQIRWYWIYYVEAKGGWYSEIPINQSPDKIRFGKAVPDMTKNEESWFSLIPQSERHPIRDAY